MSYSFFFLKSLYFFFFFLRNKHTQGRGKEVLTRKHTTTPLKIPILKVLDISDVVLKKMYKTILLM